MAEKFHFECTDCKTKYPGEGTIYLCPSCDATNIPGKPPKGVLKTVYNYQRIRSEQSIDTLFDWLESQSFLPLLPLHGMDSWPPLRIGYTPLYRVTPETTENPGGQLNGREDKPNAGKVEFPGDGEFNTLAPPASFELFLKDDSQNPTFSFKDRASALVSAWARENGIKTVVAASTGNAGSSIAGVCASQGQQAIIVVPAAAPIAKLTQILMYGAILIPVRGNYDDAFDLSVKITKRYGWYNRNTAYNPLTIEGKKTVAFELFIQLGYTVPDRIFLPVGDGVIFSGVCKGFEDLLKLGVIDRMPVMVAVQAQGSSNLVNNLASATFHSTPSVTIADSISVDIPRCFHMTAGYIREYNGETILVSDLEILQAAHYLARTTGIFSEPAAAAAYAGMVKYRNGGLITPGSKNVVLLTGSGLKDLGAVQDSITIPEPVEADLPTVEQLLERHHMVR